MMKHKLLSVAGAFALLATTSAYAQTVAPKLLPGTKTGVLSSVSVYATNATSQPMGNTLVRLRDVRFGRIVDTTITDKLGQFEFKGVDTGSYIAELMSPVGDAVLASSSIMYVGSGELLTTLLKMPFSTPALAGLLGNTAPSALSAMTSAAQAVAAAAGRSNTPAIAPSGEPATSQNPTQR